MSRLVIGALLGFCLGMTAAAHIFSYRETVRLRQAPSQPQYLH